MLDATPLVGTLGRACYAPCEGDCTRGSLEGTLPIRRLKRFASDAHDASGADNGIERPEPNGKRVAIVGSGPTGLTAAWQLARLGYSVKIFEAAPVRGRLPAPGHPVLPAARGCRRARHRERHRTSASRSRPGPRWPIPPASRTTASTRCSWPRARIVRPASGVPGEDRLGVLGGTDFLRKVKLDHPIEVAGKRVIVVGGGNVAMDAARTARRLGAASVTIAYRRSRDEMPAHHVEAEDAEKEGVAFRLLVAPAEVLGNAEGAVSGLALRRDAPRRPGCVGSPVRRAHPGFRRDDRGRRHHRRDRHAPGHGRCSAIASPPSRTGASPATWRPARPRSRTCSPPATRSTGPPTSPAPWARAARPPTRSTPGSTAVPSTTGTPGSPSWTSRPSWPARRRTRSPRRRPTAWSSWRRPTDFHEVEAPLTEAEARRAAGRCIDCAVCSECNECVSACPVDGCIDLRATRPGARGQGRRGRGVDRLQALPRRPQARVRVRPLQERHHRHADGPAAGPHAAVQHDPAARATARSRSASPTSCAPAPATRPSATRSARGSAACTPSSRTSC